MPGSTLPGATITSPGAGTGAAPSEMGDTGAGGFAGLTAGAGVGSSVALNSAVTYIDSAIPQSMIRFRFDSAYDDNRPDRGEFFYPKCGCFSGGNGPGPPLMETKIQSYQEYSTYLEYAPTDRISGFVEIPIRAINPELNANEAGLGDINAGFKYAFVRNEDTVITFQLRTYAPSGAGTQGLGTAHTTVEPALLFYHQLAPRLQLEGEFRDWIPIGGTEFESNVVRYGLGVSYLAFDNGHFRILPVTEFVGWTFLNGMEFSPDINTPTMTKSAGGDTIVNAKFGLRIGFGAATDPGVLSRTEIAISYGRALTGDVLYKDIIRAELRFRF
jgi:hypothetical protein